MPEESDTPAQEPKKPAKKADKAVVEQRVTEVLRIILDGAQTHDVMQYAADNGWNLQERQIRNYIARAHELLVERQERSRKQVIARHIAQRRALHARCVNAQDHRTALAVLDSEAKLRGLFPAADVKELAKLAAAQGVEIAELKRQLHAAGLHSPTPETPGAGTGETQAGDANPSGPT